MAILTNVNIRHSDFTEMKVTNQYAKTEVSMKKWAIFQNVNTKKKNAERAYQQIHFKII